MTTAVVVPRIAHIIREPFCGLSHFVGALLGIVALVALLIAADGRPWHVLAFSVYGLSLIFLYAASSLAHSLHCSIETGAKLDRLDYAAIFTLIAGTYTPLCLITLRDSGAWGWSLLAVEWTLAAVGVFLVLRGRGKSNLIRTIVYVAMSWLVVIAVVPVSAALPGGGIRWLLAGGIAYTVGAVIFVTKRPTLWVGRFGSHDLWHCLVLVGSACHFITIYGYIA